MTRKTAAIVYILMVIVIFASCVYAPEQSQMPSEMPSIEVPVAESWKDEVRVTATSDINALKTAPEPAWATKLVETKSHIYYVTDQGVKCVEKNKDQGVLIFESPNVHRIFTDNEALYIWERTKTSTEDIEAFVFTRYDIMAAETKVIWETTTEKIHLYVKEKIEEVTFHNGRMYLCTEWGALRVSCALGDTVTDVRYLEFVNEEYYIYQVRRFTMLGDKAYFWGYHYNEEEDAYGGCFLAEADLKTEKIRIVAEEIPESPMQIVAYNGSLYVCFEKWMSVEIRKIDIETGELSLPIRKKGGQDIDMFVEADGLYYAIQGENYQCSIYKYDETADKDEPLCALQRTMPSVRVIGDTVFYGSAIRTYYEVVA